MAERDGVGGHTGGGAADGRNAALAAGLLAIGVVAAGLTAPDSSSGRALGSIFLVAALPCLGVAAWLRGRVEVGPRRVLFLGLALAAALASAAQAHNTLRYALTGWEPVFPSPGLLIFLLGGHPVLILTLVGALVWRRGSMRADALLDLLLTTAAAAVVGVQLVGSAPWPTDGLGEPAHALIVLWRALPVAELCLAIALVVARGRMLGTRTSVALVLAMLTFALANVLHGMLALVDQTAAVTSTDVVWALNILCLAVAVSGPPGPGDEGVLATGSGSVASHPDATLRAGFVVVGVVICAQATLMLGFRQEQRVALAVAITVFSLLLAVRGARELLRARRRTSALAGNVFAERARARELESRAAVASAEAMESLRQAEWRFHTLFRSAPDAVLTLLDGGRIQEANDYAADLFGQEPSALSGRLLEELVVPDDREVLRGALASGIQGEPTRVDVHVPRGGSVRRLEIALRQLEDADPAVMLLIGRDVTAEVEMQARLVETERLAAVGELVAGVAHEVNNPLGSISAFAQLLLRDEGLTGDQRESLEIIYGETIRATQVVRDLLAFARRSAPRREAVELAQVVERALRLRGYQLASHDVRVVVEIPDELPPVVGDARQLQQVVLNLATNALQAMHGGGELRVVASAGAGLVTLSISDTGSGIPEHVRAHIFEPFFTTKEEGEGTGLGLSVSYGIIAAHGGTLALAASSSAGTTFVVTLPAETDGATGVESDVVVESAPSRSPLRGLRLLFVDDEMTLRQGMEAFGRLRGISVVTAADGRQALALLERASFDAVVCDLRMPAMDGIAFHEALGARRPGLAARTVFVTGDMVGGMRTWGRNARPITLTKPFTFDQVEDAVCAVLRGVPVVSLRG